MNKLITKIVGAALGLTMAVGVGVAVANSREILPAYASTATVASTSYSSGSFTGDLTWTASGGEDKSTYYLMRDNSSAQITSAAFNVSSSEIDLTKTVSFTIKTRTFGGTNFKTSNIVAYSDSEFSSSISDTCSIDADDKNLANKTGTLTFNNNISPTNIYFKITSSTTSAANGPGISEISFTYTEVSTGAIYSITTSVTNGTYAGDTEIQEGETATVTISPNTGYKLPTSVSVSGATSSYNSTTGEISLSNATGNVSISATMVQATQYSISTSLTGLTATGDTNIYENGTASVTLSVIDSSTKALPTTITVTNAGTYSYNSSTGVITINGATGNVSITASAINKPSEEYEDFDFPASGAGWTAVTANEEYTKTVNLITVTWEKDTGSNIAYWNPARIYNHHIFTFSAITGAGAVTTIKSITITANSDAYATNTASNNVTKTVTAGGGSIASSTASGSTVTITMSGTVTELTLVCGSTQVRWNSLRVTYEKDQSEVSLQSISATCDGVLVSQQVTPVLTFTPANATNKVVHYSVTSGSSFATVDPDTGVITGIGAGTATITITPEDTNASATTVDVVVSALPSISTVVIGTKYAVVASLSSINFELTGINDGGTYPYGSSTNYNDNPSNSFPVRVVNGLYAHTVALEVEINSSTKYLSYDKNDANNNLTAVDSIDRSSCWIFAEENSELVIRNVDVYGRKFGATATTNNNVTTGRFACYQNLSSAVITPTFVEIAEAKSDKEYVQDFVDLYMHMTDYDQGGTEGSTNGYGWCSDGQHSYYLTAKAGYNSIIHGNSTRESLWTGDSDFAAAKARYDEWARLNNDAAPYDGNDTIETKLNSANIIGLINNENGSISVIIVIVSLVSITAIGGFFFLKKRKEQ